MRLYVGNIPFSTTVESLTEYFEYAGFDVRHVDIPLDKDTQRVRGFAFVELRSPDQAATAIDTLNGQEFGGRQLQVNEARPKVKRPTSSRRYED